MKVCQFKPYMDEREYQAIKECFDTNWLTEGPKAEQFTKKICKLVGTKYGALSCNGTTALYMGLKAIGIGPGDKVIVPNTTFIASANAVIMCEAEPVFVDVEADTFQIDVDKCHKLMDMHVKAIMPVHLFGMSADMKKVMEFAKCNGIKVIEDAAQAIGVTSYGKKCGSFGDVGCFSFFADKTISCGEGGFCATSDKKIYENLLYLRNQGRLNRGVFVHQKIGYNFRMNDIQASIGLEQIKKLPEIVDKKLEVLSKYKEQLSELKSVKILEAPSFSNHIPFRVIILFEEPQQELSDFMRDRGIEARTLFYPLHKQPCFEYLKDKQDLDDENFPNSINAFEHGLCLPSYAALKDEEINYVCNVIKEYYEGK